MRRSASFSSGRVKSIKSPLVFAAMAASARRGLIDFATSSAVEPLGNSLSLPSGRLMWMLSDMESSVYGTHERRVKLRRGVACMVRTNVEAKIKSPGSLPGLDIASWYAIHQTPDYTKAELRSCRVVV